MERLVQSYTASMMPGVTELARALEKIAGDDAVRRGAGQKTLESKGCTWVVVKNRLSLTRLPALGEELRLSTWPLTSRLGLYPRCYEVRDLSGELLCEATALWAMMDISERVMISGPSRGLSILEEPGRPTPMRKLRAAEGGESFELRPTEEQIDLNGHMNNVAYIDACLERLPADWRERRLKTLAIDYEHELPRGETARLLRSLGENEALFEGRLGEKPCFRLLLTF